MSMFQSYTTPMEKEYEETGAWILRPADFEAQEVYERFCAKYLEFEETEEDEFKTGEEEFKETEEDEEEWIY